mmetsp:Transcript_4008/g.13244  ORF Transcript_4008/g.13244 Transcript_4008/m.13244 type:complete len:289 (-) Transcript_4008:152-1018(-)|eukprot:scaffold27044_cov204-Isochrysis_galbana.AAC.3
MQPPPPAGAQSARLRTPARTGHPSWLVRPLTFGPAATPTADRPGRTQSPGAGWPASHRWLRAPSRRLQCPGLRRSRCQPVLIWCWWFVRCRAAYAPADPTAAPAPPSRSAPSCRWAWPGQWPAWPRLGWARCQWRRYTLWRHGFGRAARRPGRPGRPAPSRRRSTRRLTRPSRAESPRRRRGTWPPRPSRTHQTHTGPPEVPGSTGAPAGSTCRCARPWPAPRSSRSQSLRGYSTPRPTIPPAATRPARAAAPRRPRRRSSPCRCAARRARSRVRRLAAAAPAAGCRR